MTSEKVAISIIEGLAKGSITINKTDEFKKLLVEYPDNPHLNRLFADFLKPNDHFGDDFPCDVKRPAPYLVRAASDVELLKITKQDFLTLTGEFPDLKNSLKKLIKYQLIPDTEKPGKFFRKTSRRHLSVFLGLDIWTVNRVGTP